MAITARSGPSISFGQTYTSSGAVGQYNEERGPDLSDLGFGMLDPRPAYAYQPGAAVGTDVLGFAYGRAAVDFQPSSASSNAFAISSNTAPSAGAAVTLTPSSAKGTYLTTINPPEGGAAVSVIAIDSTAAFLSFGSAGTVNYWNPAAGTGRCISITTSSSGDAGSWTIAGRDMYGFKMTETVATSSVTFTTQKAFKYISSITAASVIASTGVSIGLSDTYGFPMKVAYCGGYVDVRLLATAFSSAVPVALSSANVVLASTVATQTTSTPDVRGTYASSTATNGTVRLQMFVAPTPQALQSVTSTDVSPLFGATQFSSV